MADTGTFCTTAEVLRKAGNGANPTAQAEAYTNQYVNEIENFIMASCQYDFKTNYASLSTILKEILREATSNGAAWYVVQWDMFGYTTLEEATTMCNLLKLRFNECLALLQDGSTKGKYGY